VLSRVRTVEGLDRFQRRHAWTGFPVAVAYKFVDDQGGFLAALITYYAFLSIFPGLLLLVTVLGYVLAGNPTAQQHVLDSALAQLPVIGTELEHNITSLQGSAIALGAGAIGLLYGVLGVGQAGQLALNLAWAVPRNERPNALRSRWRSVLLVLMIGAALVATTVLTSLGASTGRLDAHLPGLARAVVIVGSCAVNVGMFALAFRILTARVVAMRDLLPGAVVAAAGWQLLQTIGTTYLSHVVARSSDVYGGFAVVLGLFAWIYLAATVTVIGAEINVVRACRLWPRSLLAPFADRKPLTAADERAYTSYAQMRRFKSHEHIDVAFDRHTRA
jgi:membrane protein